VLCCCCDTQNKWKKASTDFGTNRTVNRALGLLVAQAYKNETGGALAKTIVLRAYLSQSPAGSFNALFSGDGYTYTGVLKLLFRLKPLCCWTLTLTLLAEVNCLTAATPIIVGFVTDHL
jgi:hypothetical protein